LKFLAFYPITTLQEMETQSKMLLSLSKEKLWDLFGKHSVFSESPNTLFKRYKESANLGQHTTIHIFII